MARIFAKHAWLVAVLTVLPFLCSAQEKPFVIPLVPAADWRQVDSQPLPALGGQQVRRRPSGGTGIWGEGAGIAHLPIGQNADAGGGGTRAGCDLRLRTADFLPDPGDDAGKGHPISGRRCQPNVDGAREQFHPLPARQGLALSESDYQALLIFVGGSKPSASALRGLPSPMPSKGLVPGSEKYLLGLEAAKRVLPSFRTDLIGFDQGAEVQLGQYQTGKGTSTLMSISYPTPQIARVRFGALTNFLGLNQDRGEDSVYGRRHGSYVFLVLNAGNAGTASALMDQFQVTEGVSWDQKIYFGKNFHPAIGAHDPRHLASHRHPDWSMHRCGSPFLPLAAICGKVLPGLAMGSYRRRPAHSPEPKNVATAFIISQL